MIAVDPSALIVDPESITFGPPPPPPEGGDQLGQPQAEANVDDTTSKAPLITWRMGSGDVGVNRASAQDSRVVSGEVGPLADL